MQACRQFYEVKYIKLPELLNELALAKHAADGSFRKPIQKYKKIDLLICGSKLRTRGSKDVSSETYVYYDW